MRSDAMNDAYLQDLLEELDRQLTIILSWDN